MHQPVIDRLEEYLDGNGPFPEVEEHLSKCASCRQDLAAMQAQTALFRRAFRTEVEPDGAFYARVMNRIESQAKPSVWSLFAESMFAKRLAYASATFLLLVGVVFVSASEPDEPLAASDPHMILAGEQQYTPVTMDDVSIDMERDRQVVLANLATYQEYR
jgi:anti-sigma factor RsiW